MDTITSDYVREGGRERERERREEREDLRRKRVLLCITFLYYIIVM